MGIRNLEVLMDDSPMKRQLVEDPFGKIDYTPEQRDQDAEHEARQAELAAEREEHNRRTAGNKETS